MFWRENGKFGFRTQFWVMARNTHLQLCGTREVEVLQDKIKISGANHRQEWKGKS